MKSNRQIRLLIECMNPPNAVLIHSDSVAYYDVLENRRNMDYAENENDELKSIVIDRNIET